MVETDILAGLACDADEAGDYERARALYQRGAELGDSTCWLNLGYMFDVGDGVTVDKARAMSCYKAARRLGSPSAANNIAILYRERGDHGAMYRWFKRAAESGFDDDAFLELAKCYAAGVGVRRSHTDAVRCLRAALRGTYICEESREEAQDLLAEYALREVKGS